MPELDGIVDPESLTVVELVGAIIVLVVAGFVSRFLRRRVRAYLEQAEGISEGIPDLLGRIAGWSVLLLGFIFVLTILGFDTSGIVLLIAVIAVVVVFAGKDIVENFAAGVVLQMRGPFRVGDRIEAKGYTGTVVEINARSVIIETGDRSRVHVPNSDVLEDPIVNHTAVLQQRSDLAVGVAYDADLDVALSVITDAAAGVDGVSRDPSPGAAVGEFGESSVDLVVRFWHETGRGSSVRSAVAIAVKRALEDAGIDMPFPHRVVLSDEAP